MNDISGVGSNYPSAIGPAPTQFTLTLSKPGVLRVTWGENPQTPSGPTDGVNIVATLAGPGGSWTGGGTQKGGSVTNDPYGKAKAPAGTYTLTMTATSSLDATQGEPKATNVTISNQCSFPR